MEGLDEQALGGRLSGSGLLGSALGVRCFLARVQEGDSRSGERDPPACTARCQGERAQARAVVRAGGGSSLVPELAQFRQLEGGKIVAVRDYLRV
jgi:hypothetical protein